VSTEREQDLQEFIDLRARIRKLESMPYRYVINLMITYICAHCGGFAEVPFLEIEVFDSGTTLTCNRCGKDTVFDLRKEESCPDCASS